MICIARLSNKPVLNFKLVFFALVDAWDTQCCSLILFVSLVCLLGLLGYPVQSSCDCLVFLFILCIVQLSFVSVSVSFTITKT